jgi:putative spermidine/putrescine transport system permease protein
MVEFLPSPLRAGLWILASITLAMIIIPTLYLMVWSFCGTEVVGRLGPASLKWYRDVLTASEWLDAIGASILIAGVVATVGAGITATYDYAKRFAGRTVQMMTWAAMVLLITNPLVAYGMSVRAVAAHTALNPWAVIGLGHLAIVVPLQFLVFEAASRFLDTDMLHASRTLGANHARTFASVYVPNAIRPIVAALIIAAFVSFDELTVALFTLEGATATVPLRIWRSISHLVEPRPAVIASLVVAAAGSSWFAYEQLTQTDARSVRGFWERASGLRKEFWGAAAGFGVAHAVAPEGEGAWHALVVIVLHMVGALIGGVAIGLWKLRAILRGLFVAVNAEPRGTRKVASRFALPSVLEDVDAVEGLLGGGLVGMSRDQTRRLTAACFEEFRSGKYIGTDRNIPSRYYAIYPDYLETQLAGRTQSNDVRIVMYDRADLLSDLSAHAEEVTRFLEMHWNTGVLLLRVDWSVAEAAAHRFQLESSDLGIFDRRVALFFLPGENERGRMMLRVIEGGLRSRLQLFLDELLTHAEEVTRGTTSLIEFRALAEDERSSLQASCLLDGSVRHGSR